MATKQEDGDGRRGLARAEDRRPHSAHRRAGRGTHRLGERRVGEDQVGGRRDGDLAAIRWPTGRSAILADDEDQPAPAAAPEPTEPGATETPPAAPETIQEPPAAATLPSEPTTAETPTAAGEVAPAPAEPPIPAADATDRPTHLPQQANRRRRQAELPAKQRQDACGTSDEEDAQLPWTPPPVFWRKRRAAMSCQELIGAMVGKGYWTSPGGKTPAATLYSAMSREIATKGDLARFTSRP